ncbi:MOXD2 protein, partial [Aegotheles bennettii]|nr:MOXD2 protein [Aegotheles bennettii]
RNGEQLRIICEDNKYDFTLQEIRDVKEIITIKPVDEILVECNFQTLDRSEVTFVSLVFYLQIFHCF